MQNSLSSNAMGFKFSISIFFFVFIFLMGISIASAADLVKKTQLSLIEKGFNPGPTDGIWGPKTEGALKNFQEREGLEVNGRLNAQTRSRLFAPMESPAPETIVSDQSQQKSAPPEIPDVKQKEEEAKDSSEQMAKTSEPVAPPEDKAETIVQPAPEPEKQVLSKVKKSSGPCPQPRKTKSAPSSIAKMDKTGSADLENGKKIYTKTAKPMACKMCHGDKGDGKGKLGAALKPNPRNFTCADTMKSVSAGQMFWIIKNGSAGTGMVAHGKTLKDKEIWDVVKYIHSTFMDETSPQEASAEAAPEQAGKSAVAAVPAPVKAEPAKPAAPVEKPKVAVSSGTDVELTVTSELPAGVVGKGKYEERAVSDGGSINGVIHFSGMVPEPIMEDLSKGKNVEFCSTHPDAQDTTRPRYKIVVADGKLKDTVVFIQNIEKGKAWPEEGNNFDFQACDIFPKVSTIRKTPKGMKEGLLTITNQDPDILHNPHGYSIVGASRKTLFNKPLPSKGDVADVTKSFKRFKPKKDKHFFLQCDQHNFMEADARVVWNPYYSISGADGTFKMDQIPPGKYWVTAWHPYVGEVSSEVTVVAGSDTKLAFALKK